MPQIIIPEEQIFKPRRNMPAKSITWRVSADPTAECKKHFPAKISYQGYVAGCAGWTDNACVVITGSTTTHQILGHEIRHCFEGNFHN